MNLDRYRSEILSLLRLLIGLGLVSHGTAKFLHFPDGGLSQPLPLMMIVGGVLELVGGTLVALGLFTRPAAFVLSGQMAVAYFLFHAPTGFFPMVNGGEAAALYCFVLFYFAASGGGAWSMDRLRVRTTRNDA